MFFSAQELSDIYPGQWNKPSDNLSFSGVSYSLRHLCKGDIFVVRPRKDYSEIKRCNIGEIQAAAAQGAVAFITSEAHPELEGCHYYQVDNTRQALQALARYNRSEVQAPVVLVTGSYGKTGFKTHLSHLLSRSMSVCFTPGSANQDSAIYRSLCQIKPEHEAAIIEVSASNKSRTRKRSEIIQPDIVVITSIGHEHIHKHGSIDNIIDRKASLVRYARKNSHCIISDGPYFQHLKARIHHYRPDICILSAGEKNSHDAFLSRKVFRNFGWDIQACIRGQTASVRVPFVDVFSPCTALLELLCANLLKANVEMMAQHYAMLSNYKTSGILFRVITPEKTFILLDQSRRGGVENYQLFFRTLSYIKPDNKGRKILLTSAFMDYEDGDIQYVKANDFREPIAKAGIHSLFTVEHFPEHLEVLSDKSIWLQHKYRCDDIFETVYQQIRSDDIVCVKSIFESRLDRFQHFLRKQKDAEITPFNCQ